MRLARGIAASLVLVISAIVPASAGATSQRVADRSNDTFEYDRFWGASGPPVAYPLDIASLSVSYDNGGDGFLRVRLTFHWLRQTRWDSVLVFFDTTGDLVYDYAADISRRFESVLISRSNLGFPCSTKVRVNYEKNAMRFRIPISCIRTPDQIRAFARSRYSTLIPDPREMRDETSWTGLITRG